MSVVHTVAPTHRGQTLIFPHPQDPQNRTVQQAAKPIFQSVKQTAAWSWGVVVGGVSAAWEKVNFLFFRALNWIHPSIGPQIEIFYLRVRGVFDGIRSGWKEAQTKGEIEALRRSNQNLQIKVTQQALWVKNYRLLFDENVLLKEENQRLQGANSYLDQLRGSIGTRNESLAREVRVIEQQRLAEHKEKERTIADKRDLLKEKEGLVAEKERLEKELKQAQNEIQNLRGAIELEKQSSPHLEAQLETTRAIHAVLKQLPDSTDGMNQMGSSEIDDMLVRALPLFLFQLSEVKKTLDLAQETLSQETPEGVALLKLGRVLDGIILMLEKIPSALSRHSAWAVPARPFYSSGLLVEV